MGLWGGVPDTDDAGGVQGVPPSAHDASDPLPVVGNARETLHPSATANHEPLLALVDCPGPTVSAGPVHPEPVEPCDQPRNPMCGPNPDCRNRDLSCAGRIRRPQVRRAGREGSRCTSCGAYSLVTSIRPPVVASPSERSGHVPGTRPVRRATGSRLAAVVGQRRLWCGGGRQRQHSGHADRDHERPARNCRTCASSA
jgi:hypothetical protein